MFEESDKGREVNDQSKESAKKKERRKNVSKHLNCNYLKIKKLKKLLNIQFSEES